MGLSTASLGSILLLSSITGLWNVRAETIADASPGIMFLHLRLKNGAITLLDSSLRPGRLKANRGRMRAGRLAYEVVSSAGMVLCTDSIDDPAWQRLEYEDPNEPGAIRAVMVRHEERDFTLRLAYLPEARAVNFFHAPAGSPLNQQYSSRQDLGRVSITGELSAARTLHSAAQTATFTPLLSNGPKEKRMNVVFISEGYATNDLVKFPDDARKILGAILKTPPYNEYSNFFNAYLISVPSVESGSDHPSRSVYKDTYFNSTYDSYGLSRLLTIPQDGVDKVDALIQTYVPECDLPVLVVNDAEYGGSGGTPLVTSVNESSDEIALHEMGHTLAHLGDEYGDAYPGYPDDEEPNTTRETRRNFIKWKSWIVASTPLPTPQTSAYASAVGLFEGAHYHATGWYRPKLNCKMRELDQPFCEVCRESEVLALYSLVSPIEACSPSVTAITVTNSPVDLRVIPMTPSTHSLNIQWYLDGEIIGGATSAVFTASSAWLASGPHRLAVVVRDLTPLVRTDTAKLLFQTNVWNLNISGGTPNLSLAIPIPVGQIASARDYLVTGAIPFNAVVEASSDLAAWTALFTNKSIGAFQYTDPSSTALAWRFYRVKFDAGP